MARKRRPVLGGIIPAALIVVGVTGIVVSQAAGPSQAASKTNCQSSGGLLSAATSTLCKTLDSTTSTVKKVADGATGGATSGATSAVKQTVGGAAGAVNSVASGSGSGSTTPSGSSSGSSGGTTSGSSGSSGSSSTSSGSSGQTRQGSASGSSAASHVPSVASPLGASYRAVVLAELLRKLGVGSAAGLGSGPRVSGTASAGQASLHLPTVKPSSSKAVRVGGQARRVALDSAGPTAGLTWLLIAVAAVLAGGIGLIYTGWRNADLIVRRRREDGKPARPTPRFPVPAAAQNGTGPRAVPAPRPASGPRPALVDLRTRRSSA